MLSRTINFPQLRRDPIHPAETGVLAALVLFSASLFVIVFQLDPAITRSLTSETGLFEVIAPPLWVILALVCLSHIGFRNRHGVAAAALSLVFAARELDLHKAFTADSIFKKAFYRMDIPLAQKLAGGAVAALCVALLLWVTVAGVSYLLRQRAWRHVWGRFTILAMVLLFATKVLDRLPATLSVDYGIELSRRVVDLCHMHEEGFESLLPVVFVIALIFWRRRSNWQG